MKKNYLLILFSCLLSIHTSAHSILSFSIKPANPTSADSIRIIISCEFTSGACDGQGYLGSINNFTISSGGDHCVGMLTVICDDDDTVFIPPLPAGQYNFIYTLSVGNGFPCTPGIVPDDIDTLTFTVSPSTNIINTPGNLLTSIYPNPSTGEFRVKNFTSEKSILKMFSVDGKLVNEYKLTSNETVINSLLTQGIYIAIIENENHYTISKFVIIN